MKFLNRPAPPILSAHVGTHVDFNCSTDDPNATVTLLFTDDFGSTWRVKTLVPGRLVLKEQGPVPERPISANPGLKILFHFRIYLPMHGLEQHSVLSSLNLEVKTPEYFVSSSDMFLDKKTLLKIWVNPGLNLTVFRGTGPRCLR